MAGAGLIYISNTQVTTQINEANALGLQVSDEADVPLK